LRELELLEHLSYVIEAIAEDLSGEAKRELNRLYGLVEETSSLDPEVKVMALGRLREAQRQVKEHRYSVREAAAPLSGLSRFLWKRALPDSPGER
jgi:hypothetical protein